MTKEYAFTDAIMQVGVGKKGVEGRGVNDGTSPSDHLEEKCGKVWKIDGWMSNCSICSIGLEGEE
jgi:hypothetical protein